MVGRSPVVGTYGSLHLRNKKGVRCCHRLSLLFVFTFGVLRLIVCQSYRVGITSISLTAAVGFFTNLFLFFIVCVCVFV